MNRRQLLKTTGIVLASGIAGCAEQSGAGETTTTGDTTQTESGMTATTTANDETTDSAQTIVIDNVGAQAWEVTEAEGSVAPTGEENPTLTLTTGQRYIIENQGWDAHPFALRASDDTPLVSQSATGEFEDDSNVEWVDNGSQLEFTMTESLGSEVSYYICTIHPSMRGDVQVS